MLFNLKKAIKWKVISENKREQIAQDKAEKSLHIPYDNEVGILMLNVIKLILLY